ncbi:putative plasma membrane phosphate transporter Pho87 [Aspergillus tanneri]|uniref:Small ribosomal subunit protein uS7m n=1 Tax=Aspergillus tanneri TaxID=1220188 RepID=A0A5M9MT44_9EURO|nr:low-affinity phosphate transporter [Aspergillus tanneri]KAA8648544.1 low-affinity phosphate transporter [Aspergillus tanneri]
MPPRLNLFTARATVPVLRQSSTPSGSTVCRRSIITALNIKKPSTNGLKCSLSSSTTAQRRCNSSGSDKKDDPDRPKGPTEDTLPHVSQEAAEMARILDKKCDGTAASPELEQGTPVSEILQRDKEAQKHAPKVMQDQLKGSTGSRSFSTSARHNQPETQNEGFDDQTAAVVANMISQVTEQAQELHEGLKFPLPAPIPKTENFRKRYDAVLDQFTKLLMQDGKLSKAQKNMDYILDYLRTAPPPQFNSRRPLLPCPPAPQLPLNPVLYLTLIVDSVAPLVKIRQQKGIAGGGASVQIPVPLGLRQRRRAAMKWIIDASDKRRDTKFWQRVANELVSVAEGRSGVWERREHVHKLGVAGRSNLLVSSNRRLAGVPTKIRKLASSCHKRSYVLCHPSSCFTLNYSPSITVSSNAVGRNVARFASATSASSNVDLTSPLHPAGQSIELVEYPPRSAPAANPHQSHIEPSDSRAIGPNSTSITESKERLGQERGGDQYRPHSLSRPFRLEYWVQALHYRARFLENRGAGPKMKFSHSIQFNAVPEWSSYYIAYSNLKKFGSVTVHPEPHAPFRGSLIRGIYGMLTVRPGFRIYSLEQQVHQAAGQAHPDVESAPLLDNTPNPDLIFRRALDGELEKICGFYGDKEAEILAEVEGVARDAEEYASETEGVSLDPMSENMTKTRTWSSGSRSRADTTFPDLSINNDRRRSAVSESVAEEDEDDADSDDDHALAHYERPQLHGVDSTDPDGTRTDRRRSSYLGDSTVPEYDRRASTRLGSQVEHFRDPRILDLYNAGLSLKKRIVDTYVSICGLKSYIQLNKTGFSKALKKYDKILDRNLRREYMSTTVSIAYPFTDATMQKVDNDIHKIEGVYADVVTAKNLPLAKRELRLHLREHVVWERNTVWREMIGIERKAQAANVGIRRTLLGGDEDPAAARRQGDEQEAPTKEIKTPLGVFHPPDWLCSLSFGTLVFILCVFVALLSIPIMEKPEQQNCLAMLVFVSLLWATEVIPLFVTSLLVPFLVVLLRIMKSEKKPYERLGPKEATGVAFSAMWTPVIMLLLGGFTIAAALSKYDIARRMAMLVLSKAGSNPRVVLLTNMFVSMFLSMWISNVASPVLCYSIIQPLLRTLPPDSSFAKSLVLGIALAANVGGAASPIASPQNIIALQNMYPSISWGTWFFVSLPVCIICILLIWALLLATFHPSRDTTLVPIRPVKDKFSGVQWFISIVTLSTIALWCGSHQLEHVFGDMGVIAILPMVLFFGTGILNKEDFNNFLWTIIILAAGGLCLGKAVTSSGLLHTIANSIRIRVEHLSLYGVLIVFSSLILVVATFISHTVAALIMLPLVRQIGLSMDDPHPNLLVMASALMCSVAMGLPTSGFPNMTAIMTEVPQTGQRYLQVRHFFSRGIPASLMAFAVVVTLGYGLMYIAGL